VTDREGGEPGDPRGNRTCQCPADCRAPIVPDDVGSVDAESVEDAQDVGDQGRNPVLLHPIGPARGAEAAPVWRDHSVTSPDELGDLVPPQSCEIREAVQQQDGRPVPLVEDVKGKPR
jgi:hypothetical protein